MSRVHFHSYLPDIAAIKRQAGKRMRDALLSTYRDLGQLQVRNNGTRVAADQWLGLTDDAGIRTRALRNRVKCLVDIGVVAHLPCGGVALPNYMRGGNPDEAQHQAFIARCRAGGRRSAATRKAMCQVRSTARYQSKKVNNIRPLQITAPQAFGSNVSKNTSPQPSRIVDAVQIPAGRSETSSPKSQQAQANPFAADAQRMQALAQARGDVREPAEPRPIAAKPQPPRPPAARKPAVSVGRKARDFDPSQNPAPPTEHDVVQAVQAVGGDADDFGLTDFLREGLASHGLCLAWLRYGVQQTKRQQGMQAVRNPVAYILRTAINGQTRWQERRRAA